MEKIHNKVISILQKYAFDKKIFENASPDSNIINDLKINSARMVDVILDVEDEFQIEVDDKDLESILTVNDIVNVINKNLQRKN